MGDTLHVGWIVSDAVGVISSSATLDGVSVANGADIDTFTLAAGPHELLVTALDAAGNTSRQVVTVTVRVTVTTLRIGVERGVASGRIAKQLEVPLVEKLAPTREALKAFENQVRAQSGKKIDASYAKLLLSLAEQVVTTG
jgi:hypothetical protein